MPPKPPSAGTGITAGVLALLAGLIGACALAAHLVWISDYLRAVIGNLTFLTTIGLNALAALLLMFGAVLLFARVGAGRFMIIAGALLVLGMFAWSFIQVGVLAARALSLIILLLALVAAVLAVLPPTNAWIAAKKRPMQPGFPPPGHPGYGPPRQW